MRNLVVFYLFKFSKKNDHNKQHQQRVKFFLQWNCQIPGKVAWNRITAQDLCHNWKLSFNNGVFKFSVFFSNKMMLKKNKQLKTFGEQKKHKQKFVLPFCPLLGRTHNPNTNLRCRPYGCCHWIVDFFWGMDLVVLA